MLRYRESNLDSLMDENDDKAIVEKLKVFIRERPPPDGVSRVPVVSGDDEGNVIFDEKV